MNIPLLFKIFLFLMFKQNMSDKISLQYETKATILKSFPIVSILVLEGDESSLEVAINNCSMVLPTLVIVHEPNFEKGISLARLQYKDLLFSTRQQLERQLHQYKGRINIHWD